MLSYVLNAKYALIGYLNASTYSINPTKYDLVLSSISFFIYSSISYGSIYNSLSSFLLLIILFITVLVKKDRSIPMWFGYIFFFVDGITLFPVVAYYIGTEGVPYVVSIFTLTIIISGALALYGYFTKNDLTSWGGILFAGLLALLVVTIINLFLHNNVFGLIISFIGVILFCLYIMYDMNKLKNYILAGRITETNDLTWHVINLYLDIVNLFLRLLRLLNRRR